MTGFSERVGLIRELCCPRISGCTCTDCYHRARKHPGRVYATRVGVTIKHYFGPASRGSRTSFSMTPEDLEQVTQKIKGQLKDSITQKMQSQMQSEGLALPPKVEVGPSTAHVSTKETGDSDKCGLYVDGSPPRLVAFGRVHEGSMTIHNVPLGNNQVKVGVEEARDADARILIPTQEVQLVGQTLNTFLAWATHLVKPFLEQDKLAAEGSTKPVDMSDPIVNPLYLMTLTIPQLFLKSLQVSWDATVFGNSQRDVYLGAYLNGVLKGFNDNQGSKSKAIVRWIVVKQHGSTMCGYYVIQLMSTIVLGVVTNQRPLEPNRMKAICIQWARYYLKVKNQTLGI
ncbi:hypothetical protein HKD37_15G043632 [Glycine soja]